VIQATSGTVQATVTSIVPVTNTLGKVKRNVGLDHILMLRDNRLSQLTVVGAIVVVTTSQNVGNLMDFDGNANTSGDDTIVFCIKQSD
jgi:hypothetical protein